MCVCGQCEWANPLEDKVIEVEDSSNFNPEVEICVDECEASEVESLRFVLPDSLGYSPTSPEGVAKNPIYSPTSLDYFLSNSLYSPTFSRISFDGDFWKTEEVVEVVEPVVPESVAKTMEPATPTPKPRKIGTKANLAFNSTNAASCPSPYTHS